MQPTRRELLTGLSTILAGSAALPGSLARAASPAAALATLARDVDRVESVRAVKRLQHAWALYTDLGQWDRSAGLFAPDAELAHGDDRYRGPQAIRDYFVRAIGKGTSGLPARTVHAPFLMAPLITMADDGDSAKGRWHAFSMRGSFGREASWQGGIFECEYRRQGGEWRIQRQIFTPMLVGPYETGWNAARPELPIVPYHYRPDEVGKPFDLGPEVPASGDGGISLTALGARVEALLDETTVRNLQHAYGYYVDFKMWDDVADLFEPGASLELEGVGAYRGPRGIRRYLESLGPAGLRYGEVNDRIQHNTIVELSPDGRHARARGLELGMLGEDNQRAWWTLARFDNLFAKRGGVWRIERMRLQPWLRSAYDKGWAKDWQAPPAPSSRPDGPARAFPPAWQFERKPPPASPSRMASVAQARTMLHRAAAQDSAENLTAGYGQYLDDNQWEDLGSIFAAQGERDSAGGGFIRTPARIASFSRKRYGPYNPKRTGGNMHMLTQPVVHVSADGRIGQIRARLFQTAFGQPAADGSTRAMIVTGMYENDLVFEDGAWKIKRADIDHLIYAPYKTGWTHLAEGSGARMNPPLGAVADEKFDAMDTGDINAAFPKVPHMWFHYRNPVSGRSPPYLMPKYVLPEP